MLGAVFERFVEKSPISVMVRASLERVLGADRLDLWYERTAQKQYTRDLLFSSVYDLMNQVVFCIQPSVRAAYQAHQHDVGTSLVSVYNKLNGLETQSFHLRRDSRGSIAYSEELISSTISVTLQST